MVGVLPEATALLVDADVRILRAEATLDQPGAHLAAEVEGRLADELCAWSPHFDVEEGGEKKRLKRKTTITEKQP